MFVAVGDRTRSSVREASLHPRLYSFVAVGDRPARFIFSLHGLIIASCTSSLHTTGRYWLQPTSGSQHCPPRRFTEGASLPRLPLSTAKRCAGTSIGAECRGKRRS